MDGTIFNIQHYTIHDGPGIRTEVFLKGCPLHCPWCSNPEGQSRKLQLGVYSERCLSESICGLCKVDCLHEDALLFADEKLQAIDSSKCISCMKCVNTCPADAIKQWGENMSVGDVMKEILMDRGYYERSGGGVTVSGGEPLMQADFVAELFQECKKEGIHTCCETALSLPWEEVEKVLPWTDLLITDLKHMDSEIHRGFSGAGNERILENQKKIVQENKTLVIRIPVIPGVNDDQDNIEQTAEFILNDLEGKVRTLQLLSFMRLGEEKYKSLGRPYTMKDVEVDRQAFQTQVEKIAAYFNSRGIHCAVGAKEW